jgi:hypothetical protein
MPDAASMLDMTIREIVSRMPESTDMFRQFYWRSDDGRMAAVVIANGDVACDMLGGTMAIITDDPIDGPNTQALRIGDGGIEKARAILAEKPRSFEEQDVDVIMMCLEDATRAWGDMLRMADVGDTMRASLSRNSVRSCAFVLGALLNLYHRSGIPVREVVDYLGHSDAFKQSMDMLRKSLKD